MRNQKRERERKRLQRIGLAFMWVCIFVFTVLACAMIGKREGEIPKRSDFTPVMRTIQAGDTAWRIADEYCPDTLDKRVYLGWCEQLNGGSMGYIKAGEQVVFLEIR